MFVVWSDQLGAEPRHIAAAAELIADSRARHYWDGGELVGRAYQRLELDGRPLALPDPAWDVWMLFGRDAEWKATPPQPAWWEHQLRRLPAQRHLDAERFAAKAKALRAQPGPERRPTATHPPAPGKHTALPDHR